MERTSGWFEAAMRAAVSERLGEARFGRWFGEGVELKLTSDGAALEVRVPNAYFREWIESHYMASLLESAEAVLGRRLAVLVKVDEPPQAVLAVGVHRAPPAKPSPPLRAPSQATRAERLIREIRKLDDFVTGPGNQLAHAAACEMARSAGAAFNPLLIHGAIGLGKTHLLEGIAHGLKLAHPSLRIVQLTAEGFTNSFLEAMRAGALTGFRSRYRSAGGLIVDDVHFLAAKRATMVEFLHTFNALLELGSPVVLSADQHPRLISRLTDELVTRFLGGMVVRLEPPDLATRQKILRKKADERGVHVPEAVLAFIAEHLRASVRELEGALYTVIAQAVLSGKRVDLSAAQAALRDTIRHTGQSVVFRDIERVVCQLFQIKVEALKSESRVHAVVYPRMLAMYLARKHTDASYTEIGRHFGGRDHSTVISAEKKVQAWLRAEEQTGLLPGFQTIGDLLAELEKALGA